MRPDERVFVKVCGLRTPEDVEVAVDAGADAVGFVVAEGSPRNLSPQELDRLVSTLAGRALSVLVVKGVPVSEVLDLHRRLDLGLVQLHGYSDDEVRRVVGAGVPVWVARRPQEAAGGEVGGQGEQAWLVDSPEAGSGRSWDHGDFRAPVGRWLVAGGLDSENVGEAIRALRPWGVDVSSGVEIQRGVKDHRLIRAFVAAARSAD